MDRPIYDRVVREAQEGKHTGNLIAGNTITGNVGHRIEIGDKHTFDSGASSSGRKPRYDLIPTWAMERIARRFELGASKYGVDNWQRGLRDQDFIFDRINHAIEHLLILRDKIREERVLSSDDDDAAAVVLNAIFVMGHERTIVDDLYRAKEASASKPRENR